MVTREMLEGFADLGQLQKDEIEALTNLAEEERYPAGQFIFHEGGTANKLFLVLEGRVDMLMNTNAEGTHREPVMTVGPGEIFGWSALVEPFELTASARCNTPVRVISVYAPGVRALMTLRCTMGLQLMQKVCQVASARLRATRVQLLGTVRPVSL
jgi:CRP-like cAMP-binding protein